MSNSEIVYDISKIIQEIQILLDNKFYFSALTSALILPDACSKIERKLIPNTYLHTKEYITWCNRWLLNYLRPLKPWYGTQGTWGSILYKLRCGLMHNIELDVCGKQYINFNLEDFSFYINKKGSFSDISASIDSSTVTGGASKYFLSPKTIQMDEKNGVNAYNKLKIKIDIYYLIAAILDGTVNFAKHYNLTSKEFPSLLIDVVEN